jgi:flagellar secretion chaperone FliS
MNAYASAAPAAYKESSIMTAPPERLVVMLYEGVNRFLAQAVAAMRENDLALSNDRLQRAEAIITELNATLDMSAGDIAERLRAIYLFSNRHLGEARIERSPEKIETVARLLGELRESWAQIAGQ